MQNDITHMIALRDAAFERLTTARTAHAEVNALPKGTRGKAARLETTWAVVEAANAAYQDARQAIRKVNRGKAVALVDAALDRLAGVNSVARQVLVARTDRRRQAAVHVVGHAFGVHVRLSLDAYGMPNYVELSMLATADEYRNQVDHWLSRATTPEARANVQPFIDAPEANPLAHFGSSVTLSRGHGDNANRYGVNGSTFSTHNDDEAARLRLLHAVAWDLMDALNAADLPKAEDLENLVEGMDA